MNIVRLFQDRRSVRGYTSDEISNDIILRILEAARWAPSAHNAQPWRLVVIREPIVKKKLAEAMARRWRKDMRRDGVSKEHCEALTKASIQRFSKAPVLIVACLTMGDMHKYPDRKRQEIERVMTVQSVAAAVENLLLAAHLEGLGSCWSCAPLFCPDIVRKALGIPSHIEPQALVTLGYPANRPEPPPRKSLEEIVYQNLWRNVG